MLPRDPHMLLKRADKQLKALNYVCTNEWHAEAGTRYNRNWKEILHFDYNDGPKVEVRNAKQWSWH